MERKIIDFHQAKRKLNQEPTQRLLSLESEVQELTLSIPKAESAQAKFVY